MEKKIKRTATYNIEWIVYEDGTTHLKRTTQGFNGFELLGMCELISKELIEQIKGNIKPDLIERNVIVDKTPNPNEPEPPENTE